MARPRRGTALVAGTLLAALGLAGCGPHISITIGQPPETPVPMHVPASSQVAGTAPSPDDRPATGSGSLYTGWGTLNQGVLRTPPATTLAIPALGISVPVEQVASAVVDGVWQWPVPAHSAGHHLGTANPGEPGNIVVSGHVEIHEGPGIFAPLLQAAPGHEITVESAAGTFTYRIESVMVVPETDTSVFLQVPFERLTLITCIPDGVYDDRLVVVARPVGPTTAHVP